MNRMIIRTAIALCCLSLFFNVAFANRPTVEWGSIQLSTQDVKLGLKNIGSYDWARFSITVKVYDGEKPVSTGMISQAKGLAASKESMLRFGLNKPLEAGKAYKVKAWLQSGSPQLVSRDWTVSIPSVSTP